MYTSASLITVIRRFFFCLFGLFLENTRPRCLHVELERNLAAYFFIKLARRKEASFLCVRGVQDDRPYLPGNRWCARMPKIKGKACQAKSAARSLFLTRSLTCTAVCRFCSCETCTHICSHQPQQNYFLLSKKVLLIVEVLPLILRSLPRVADADSFEHSCIWQPKRYLMSVLFSADLRVFQRAFLTRRYRWQD